MNRLHIHIAVKDLSESVAFYSTIFGSTPSVEKTDYAKWDLTDPAVNFAISNRGKKPGINHLGIEVDSDNELSKIAQRLDAAEIKSSSQEGTSCCYSHSNKHWVLDPQGISWESFHSLGNSPVYGEDNGNDSESSACCIPLSLDEADDNSAACCIPSDESDEICCA